MPSSCMDTAIAAHGTFARPEQFGSMSSRPAIPAQTGPEQGASRTPPPTTDRLRIDIDRGATGEKVNYPDPAAAPFGTDDEAAGHPASAQERQMEVEARPLSRHEGRSRKRPMLWIAIGTAVGAGLLLAALLGA